MLAVGFTLIFGVARILNLAHGSFYALGAYFAYLFSTELKLPAARGGGPVRRAHGAVRRAGARWWSSGRSASRSWRC